MPSSVKLRLQGNICCSGSCSPHVHVIPSQMLISLIYEGAAFPNRPSVCAPYLCGKHASSGRGGFVLRADWSRLCSDLVLTTSRILDVPHKKAGDLQQAEARRKECASPRGGQQRTRSYLHIMQHPLSISSVSTSPLNHCD